MPTIAWFYGMTIQMYYDDHEPPHFHARYGRAKAIIRLLDGETIAGELPPTATRMVRRWALARSAELQDSWRRARRTCLWRKWLVPMPTNDLPMVDVLRLRALDGHRLWVRFTDGSEGVRDFSDLLADGGPMVEPLKAPEYFARAFVEMGAPTWPNGFDVDPINLYMRLRDAGALTRTAAE